MNKISLNLPIYTYQIDFAGHVSNIVYIQWMEIGRLQLLEAVGMPVHQISEDGFIPVLVHTEIRYKNPLYLGDTVKLDLWISELKNVSARLEFRFYNGEDILAATGQQQGLFVDIKNKRPKRLKIEDRKLFEAYVHSESAV